jgi:hypothetical protein
VPPRMAAQDGRQKKNQVHLTQGAEHGATSTVAMSIMKGKDNLQTTVARNSC